MIANFYTKRLNGSKFRKFRNLIMNCDNDVDDDMSTPSYVRTAVIPKTMLNDPHKGPTYKDALVGSQECVGSNWTNWINQRDMTNNGKALWHKATDTMNPFRTVQCRNKRVRFAATKRRTRASE